MPDLEVSRSAVVVVPRTTAESLLRFVKANGNIGTGPMRRDLEDAMRAASPVSLGGDLGSSAEGADTHRASESPAALVPRLETIARTAWEARRQFIAVDVGEEDDMGPWPPTAGNFGWQEDDAEHVIAVQMAEAAALSRLLALPTEQSSSPAGQWQAIEEHDGSYDPVLVCATVFVGGDWNSTTTKQIVGEARFKGPDSCEGWWWINTDSEYGEEIHPTHWQPLPAAPEAEG